MIVKTKIRKWVSIEISDRGWGGQGRKQLFYLPDFPYWISKNELPAMEEGDKFKVSIYGNKSDCWLQDLRLTVPNIETINSMIEDHAKYTSKFTKYRDFQRSRCYKAESSMVRRYKKVDNLTQKQIDRLARRISKEYNLPRVPTMIVTPAKKRWSHSYGWLAEIRLAKGWGQNKDTVLHELAHQIVYQRDDINDRGHGPCFVAIVIKLYEKYLGWNRKQMLKIASQYKLKVDMEILND